jgi:hypothetical protein
MRSKLSIEERMIKDLLKRKREYEKYFKSIDTIDNQAQSAYTSIIKTIVELSRKTVRETKSSEEMKKLAEEILESEYGIRR